MFKRIPGHLPPQLLKTGSEQGIVRSQKTSYWQTEAGHLESNQKIVSQNLLCLQLKDVEFGRSWVRILRASSIFQHWNMSNISQVYSFIQPCIIKCFKECIKSLSQEIKQEKVLDRKWFEPITFRYDLFAIQIQISAVASACQLPLPKKATSNLLLLC